MANLTGKHLCRSLLQASGLKACNFINKKLEHRCFPVNIAKFLRTLFSQNTSGGCSTFFQINQVQNYEDRIHKWGNNWYFRLFQRLRWAVSILSVYISMHWWNSKFDKLLDFVRKKLFVIIKWRYIFPHISVFPQFLAIFLGTDQWNSFIYHRQGKVIVSFFFFEVSQE